MSCMRHSFASQYLVSKSGMRRIEEGASLMQNIVIDEEFKSLLPALDKETFESPEENILRKGESITTYTLAFARVIMLTICEYYAKLNIGATYLARVSGGFVMIFWYFPVCISS